MAYRPISGTVPQYTIQASGTTASGYWLKFYEQGTPTSLPMGIDATPTSTLVKCTLNSLGQPISNPDVESTRFIPHLNAAYDAWIFPTEALADANNTAAGTQVADNVNLEAFDFRTVATYAAARALDSSTLTDGQRVWIDGYAFAWEVKTGTVTDNGWYLVFTDDSNRYLESTAPEAYLEIFGCVGDYTTDDTACVDLAMAFFAATGIPLRGDKVYRYTGTLALPAGLILRGKGSPRIAAFPQTGGDKSLLRPGYKDQISGACIIFDGTGTTSNYTTNRSDGFSTVTPMVTYLHYQPYSIQNIAFIQDMDVLDSGGTLTTGSTDNRATAYTAGMVDNSTLSETYNFVIFGYFNDAGYIIHNQDGGNLDPDYVTHTNALITGGVAIIGHDTAAGTASEGLTGSKWMGSQIYGADHHTRADGIYTVPCLYIDGFVSTTGIRGHSFTGCNFRTYANDAMSFDHCNDIQLVNSVWEFPALGGVTNADASGGFVGTSNTGDFVVVGGAGTSDPKLLTFLTQIGGKYQIIGAGAFGHALFGEGQSGIRIAGDDANNDGYLQLTDDISSTATGWKLERDSGSGDEFIFKYDNVERFRIDKDGGVRRFGLASSGTLTISSGAVTVGSGNNYLIDTESAGATDDLTTISGGVFDGQMLIIRPASSSRDVVVKDGTGNIRCVGDFTMDNGQDRMVLMFDGSNWVELCRADNTT